jgi:hypothetical protein
VVWTSDEYDGSIDRLLEQLAGSQPTNVDVRSVRRRARRVRRIRFVRHLGAATVAVAAAAALSQSMIGGTAQQGDLSADDAAPRTALVASTTSSANVGPPSSAVTASRPRADAAGRATDAVGAIPLVPSAATGTTWARDQAYDLVAGEGTDNPTRAARRVNSW